MGFLEISLFAQVLLAGFVIALIMGFVLCRTNFCVMGAVADLVYMGESGRMRSWLVSMALAILGVSVLDQLQMIDVALTSNPQTGKPPYTTARLNIFGHVIGGILFGIGMCLGSGCGNKTLIRIGEGSVKSVVVFLAMGLGGYLMIYPNIIGYNDVIYHYMPHLDLRRFGIETQGVDAISAWLFGIKSEWWRVFVAFCIALPVILWALSSRSFRNNPHNIIGAVTVAIAVVLVWFITAGALGMQLIEEAEFMDEVPRDLGAQSLTFVKSPAQFLFWMLSGLGMKAVSLALVVSLAVILGAFISSCLARRFSIVWFANSKDLLFHLVGGFLMGTGGVLSWGCTFGQAISGASMLAIGSFLTFLSIVVGASLTLRTQFYILFHEEKATLWKAIISGLVDIHLLPEKFRLLKKQIDN